MTEATIDVYQFIDGLKIETRRILLACAKKYANRRDTIYNIRHKEYSCNIGQAVNDYYRQLETGGKMLKEMNVCLEGDEVPIICSNVYKAGMLTLRFTPESLAVLEAIRNELSDAFIDSLMRVKGKNPTKLTLFIMRSISFDYDSEIEVDPDAFRAFMGITETYQESHRLKEAFFKQAADVVMRLTCFDNVRMHDNADEKIKIQYTIESH